MSFKAMREEFFKALDRLDGSVRAAAREVGANENTAAGWARRAGIRGRGTSSTGPHPGRGEYERLRAGGMTRRDAAAHVRINERTARDWDKGVRKTRNSRTYPDGRRVDYNNGMTTLVAAPALPALEAELHPRFLTLTERETIADLHRAGAGLRTIGRALNRPASTIKREIDARSEEQKYQRYSAQRVKSREVV